MVSQIYPGFLADNMFGTYESLVLAPKRNQNTAALKQAARMAGYHLPVLPPKKFDEEIQAVEVLDESAFYTELDILTDEKPLIGYDDIYSYTDYEESYSDFEDSALLALEAEIESLLDELEDTPALQDVEPLYVDFESDYIYSDDELDELMAELVDYDYNEYKFFKNFYGELANTDLDALERTINAQFSTQLDVEFDYEETEIEYNLKKYDSQYKSLADDWFDTWCKNNHIQAEPQSEYETCMEEYDPEELVSDLKSKELNLEFYKALDEYLPKEKQTPNEKGTITKYKKGTLKGWNDNSEPEEPLGIYYNKYRKNALSFALERALFYQDLHKHPIKAKKLRYSASTPGEYLCAVA